MAGRLAWARRGSICEIRFDNPAKFNAMTLDMWRELAAMVQALHADPHVRVLLLRGEGDKAFISGADIAEFDTARSAETGSDTYDSAVGAAQFALIDCPFPVVAAIHGICMGGGLGLVTSCDLRYCAQDAKFRMPAARLGLGYGFDGIHRMVQVVGEACTAEMFFTARMFDGVEAQRIGLVHQAFAASELDAQVEAVLAQVAANAPLTVRLAKEALRLARFQPPGEAAAQVQRGRQQCVTSADYAEGRRAFAERRTPVFKGR